ncbi:MAG TPA: hypothetical protein VM840_02100 [Actinomycetota bacterium]|nr:hypothetical protein [Actinomycetota bacterium]
MKVERDPNDTRAKPPRGDLVVRPGLTGEKAQQIWQGLADEIEGRWRDRLGGDLMSLLMESLGSMVRALEGGLPRYLPVLTSADLRTDLGEWSPAAEPGDHRLVTMLARTLLAFTSDFEGQSELSLPLAANVVRALDEEGVPVGDLPASTGVSKEAVSMSLTFLEKNGYASVFAAPSGARGRWARLTPKGRDAQRDYIDRVPQVEGYWRTRFGGDAIDRIRDALERVIHHPRFSESLQPHPGGWRTKKPYQAQTEAFLADPHARLPYHPMVLHRGGWPDGS